MNDWTDTLVTLVGYAIVAGMLVLPIVAVALATRSRWFARRRRIRWAGHGMPLPWQRGAMDSLPPPFNEDPDMKRSRRR